MVTEVRGPALGEVLDGPPSGDARRTALTVRIRRFNPEVSDESWWDEFEVEMLPTDRLLDALNRQAFAALSASPGARAYYDQIRARGTGHQAALRQLGNRLVGILHGCLKTAKEYDEAKAWASQQDQQLAA